MKSGCWRVAENPKMLCERHQLSVTNTYIMHDFSDQPNQHIYGLLETQTNATQASSCLTVITYCLETSTC